MSDRGQAVIPVGTRRAIGFNRRVDVTAEGGAVCIRPFVPMPLAAAQGGFRGKPTVDLLLRERRRDG